MAADKTFVSNVAADKTYIKAIGNYTCLTQFFSLEDRMQDDRKIAQCDIAKSNKTHYNKTNTNV